MKNNASRPSYTSTEKISKVTNKVRKAWSASCRKKGPITVVVLVAPSGCREQILHNIREEKSFAFLSQDTVPGIFLGV